MEKKNKIPFDKIDITTASDDDIIKSGIKHNTSKDIFCYFVMFLILVLALLPLLFRIFIPRKVTTKEEEIVYFNITCYKTTIRDDYELATTLHSNYRDGNIETVTFDFNIFKRNELAEDGYVFPEINDFDRLKLDGVTSKKEEGKVSFKFDYKEHPELKENETLKEYSYISPIELNFLTNDKGYSCSTNTETKVEVIDIETRKKIK